MFPSYYTGFMHSGISFGMGPSIRNTMRCQQNIFISYNKITEPDMQPAMWLSILENVHPPFSLNDRKT